MPRVTADMTITLDGYASGRDQSRERPFGDIDPERLHAWMFDHVDENAEERAAITVAGAYIMGRKMFASDQGEWDLDWRGWWGPNPPYHAPTFVLCHRPRPSIEMEGGTVFHFVTDGIEAALERARTAAKGKDIRLGGGASVIRQYLKARLVDEMHLAVSPVLLGSGEHLLAGIDLPALGYTCTQHVASPKATHVSILRR